MEELKTRIFNTIDTMILSNNKSSDRIFAMNLLTDFIKIFVIWLIETDSCL